MRTILALALAALLAVPAAAGETPWQEVAPGVKLRLISTGQIKANGTTLVGLEIDMPETTKTYWRVPGDTGMPTELDFAGSTGIASHQIEWPYPTRHEGKDYLDYAYFGPTVLPIALTLDAAAPTLALNAVLGVCSDICIPAQASFTLDLAEAKPDRPNGLRLRQWLAMAPIPWEGDTPPIGDVALQPDGKAIGIRLIDPDLDPLSLIAATPSGEPLFGAPQKSPQANLILVPILGKADQIDLEGQDIQLTFITGMGAFEITRSIGGPLAE